jgi:hypothetical protein
MLESGGINLGISTSHVLRSGDKKEKLPSFKVDHFMDLVPLPSRYRTQQLRQYC